uniref:Transmembrane protein 17 n=1 Tax=Pseudonaja textilis TaxID=8673 RepID=A0A670YYY7_PSETE
MEGFIKKIQEFFLQKQTQESPVCLLKKPLWDNHGLDDGESLRTSLGVFGGGGGALIWIPVLNLKAKGFFRSCIQRSPNLESGTFFTALFFCPLEGQTVLSSLPLQMLLYFNVIFLPFWCLSEAVMLELKFSLLSLCYQCLLVAAYVTIVGAESARLLLGYIGNLQEKVPELAGFLLLSFVIEMPVLLFILTDHQVIQMPLEMAVHGVLLCFLTSEIMAASFALKEMAMYLARVRARGANHPLPARQGSPCQN